MAGTREGGLKIAAKNKARDPDFYRRIGSIGGKRGNTGGFAARIKCYCAVYPEPHIQARCAGYRGGTNRRKKLYVG